MVSSMAKKKKVEPNEEETVKITVDPYDFASFDNKDKNTNNFKGWELEKGDYVFHAANNSHTDFGTFTKKLANDEKYEKDPDTGYEVKTLKRIQHATLQLDGLKRGEFKPIKPQQIKELKNFLNRIKKDA